MAGVTRLLFMKHLNLGAYKLALDRPLIMGIVNLTPDSFSGDGLAGGVDAALRHAREQWEAGADILDIGAESSRPGAVPTPLAEELARLRPVLDEVCSWGVPVSVDTYKPAVMAAALECGAAMINDIAGMRDPAALDVVSSSNCGVCLMHMQGVPGSMQVAPNYCDVVTEVLGWLERAVERCIEVGVSPDRLVIDPGFGFGKTQEHNESMFRALPVFAASSYPLLVGVSRKSMLGTITGRPVGGRVHASVAAALLAVERGAAIVRVHDVSATLDALQIRAALG